MCPLSLVVSVSDWTLTNTENNSKESQASL